MNVKNYVIIVFLVLSQNLFSQKFDLICNYNENSIENAMIDCLSKKEENQYTNIVTKIAEKSGISSNFKLITCNSIENACAIINPLNNNQRYILFDYYYFKKMYNDDAAIVFIIAHEIGHHINGHTIPSYQAIEEKRKKELEADYFAGSIMFKFGYNENKIIEIISKLQETNNPNSTHPLKKDRLEYSLKGYFSEFNRINSKIQKNEKQLIDNIYQGVKFEIYENLKLNLKNYDLTGDIKHLNIAEYLIGQLKESNNENELDITRAFIFKKIGKYDEAQKLYLSILKKNFNNEYALIDLLEVASKTSYNKNNIEIDNLINEFEKKSKNPKFFLNSSIYYNRIDDYDKFIKYSKIAYDLIKNDNESLLKSDILFHYGRALYDEQINNKSKDFQESEQLIYEALKIVEKYPKNREYYFYYDAMLFHYANILYFENKLDSALEYYTKLLNSTNRIDYKYKTNYSLFEIYKYQKKYLEAIQHITNSINITDDNNLKSYFLYQRGVLYVLLDNFKLSYNDFYQSCNLNNKTSCELINNLKNK